MKEDYQIINRKSVKFQSDDESVFENLNITPIKLSNGRTIPPLSWCELYFNMFPGGAFVNEEEALYLSEGMWLLPNGTMYEY